MTGPVAGAQSRAEVEDDVNPIKSNLDPTALSLDWQDVLGLATGRQSQASKGERDAAVAMLGNLNFFQGMPLTLQKRIFAVAQYQSIEAGIELCNEDSEEDVPLCILLSGCIALTCKETHGVTVSTLTQGEYFGDDQTLDILPVGSKYYTMTKTAVLCIDKYLHPDIMALLEKRELAAKVAYLSTQLVVPIFQGLPAAQIENVAKSMYRRNFGLKQVIIKEKERGNCMYFIAAGTPTVLRDIEIAENGTQTVKSLELATLRPGEYFGELSLLGINVDTNPRNNHRHQFFEPSAPQKQEKKETNRANYFKDKGVMGYVDMEQDKRALDGEDHVDGEFTEGQPLKVKANHVQTAIPPKPIVPLPIAYTTAPSPGGLEMRQKAKNDMKRLSPVECQAEEGSPKGLSPDGASELKEIQQSADTEVDESNQLLTTEMTAFDPGYFESMLSITAADGLSGASSPTSDPQPGDMIPLPPTDVTLESPAATSEASIPPSVSSRMPSEMGYHSIPVTPLEPSSNPSGLEGVSKEGSAGVCTPKAEIQVPTAPHTPSIPKATRPQPVEALSTSPKSGELNPPKSPAKARELGSPPKYPEPPQQLVAPSMQSATTSPNKSKSPRMRRLSKMFIPATTHSDKRAVQVSTAKAPRFHNSKLTRRQSSVVNYVPVEVFVLPYVALEMIPSVVIDRMSEYASGYPKAPEIQAQYLKSLEWASYKKVVMEETMDAIANDYQ